MRPTARIGAPSFGGATRRSPSLVLVRDGAPAAARKGSPAAPRLPAVPRLLGAVLLVMALGSAVVVAGLSTLMAFWKG